MIKYIITENQSQRISILRRIESDWSWISEIVFEGLDLDNPCDFKDVDTYLERVASDSSRTYLYHFIDEKDVEIFSILFEYIIGLIIKRLGDDIIEHYVEGKEDC